MEKKKLKTSPKSQDYTCTSVYKCDSENSIRTQYRHIWKSYILQQEESKKI